MIAGSDLVAELHSDSPPPHTENTKYEGQFYSRLETIKNLPEISFALCTNKEASRRVGR